MNEGITDMHPFSGQHRYMVYFTERYTGDSIYKEIQAITAINASDKVKHHFNVDRINKVKIKTKHKWKVVWTNK